MRRAACAALSVLALLAIAGCSSSSFVAQGFEDFTAYYNKFYNAERSFREANKRQSTQRSIDRELIMLVFPVSERAGATRDYENSIRKSADVLRGHENSKWVDNALMLIGRAYFNQQNFVSAEQKFREVMALDTKLRDEARYWLARSQIAGNQYEAAYANLEAALSEDRISRKWRPYFHLAVGELRVREGDYAAATEPLTEGLRVGDKRTAARAQFLLAQVYEKLGDDDTAIEMYQRVRKYKPPYEIAYAAQVRAIEVGAVRGDWQESERALRKMERDDKNYENRHDLAVVRGKLLAANGQHDEAIGTLTGVLRSSDPPQPHVRGAVHYTLARLYRDEFQNYARAAAHFDTAATALQGQIVQRRAFGTEHSISDPFAPGAIVNVLDEKAVFQSFAAVAARVGRMDSLLALGTMDEADFRARVEEIRQLRIAELKEQDRLLEKQNIEGQFNAGAGVGNRGGLPPGKVLDYDADAAAAGFLFHKEPIRVQQAFQLFRDKWGERPLVPGWRVSSNISGVTRVNTAVDSTLLAQATGTGEDKYANITIDVSAVPRSRAAQDRMRAERAIARYEMGNVLFLSMNLPDSAATWYQLTIDEDEKEPVAARAHYALAELYRSIGQAERADDLMEKMARLYPDVDLTIVDEDEPSVAGANVLKEDAEAETSYERAFDVWARGEFADAVVEMLTLASRHGKTTAAPRALLAVGTIAGDWARRDSLDMLDALPVVIPDSLAAHFGWGKSVGDSTAIDSTLIGSALIDSTVFDSTLINSTGSVVDVVASSAVDAAAVDSAGSSLAVADSVLAPSVLVASAKSNSATGSAGVVPLVASGGADSIAVKTVDSAGTLIPAPQAGFHPSVIAVYEYLATAFPRDPAATQANTSLRVLRAQLEERQAIADSVAAAATAAAELLTLVDSSATADSLMTETGQDSVLVSADVESATDTLVVGSPSGLGSVTGEMAVVSSDSAVFVPAKGQDVPVKGQDVPVKGQGADVVVADTIDARQAPIIMNVADIDVEPVLIGGDDGLARLMALEQFGETLSGIVTVSFVVTEGGQVSQVVIEKGVSETIDREVTRALYQSRFRPGSKDNRLVAVRVTRDIKIEVE